MCYWLLPACEISVQISTISTQFFILSINTTQYNQSNLQSINRMKLIIALLLLAIFHSTHSAKVVDLYGVFNNFACLARQGYYHTIIRAYHSYGAIDLDAPALIQQSNKAGLSTDVYMFPCRGKNASVQVKELIDYLQKMTQRPAASAFEYTTGDIWLDIETNPSSGCTWNLGTPESNCQYVKELITAIEARGREVGIYASAYMWNQIMGNKDACAQFSNYPLWYAHYDGKQDFSDWQANKFGGWTTPAIKQYAGDSVLCGYKVDLSYY